MISTRSTGQSQQGQMVEKLGARIARGAVGVGQTLDPGELASTFGVSRSVVREAFRTLEALGMISARPRIGTVVRETTAWNLLDSRVIRWRNDGPDAAEQLRELMVLRQAIEPTSAHLAASRCTADELLELEGLLTEMAEAKAASDIAAFARADAAFHTLITQASRNAVLQQLLGTLEAVLHSRYSTTVPIFSSATTLALERHGELVAALRARDGEAAAATMGRLIHESQQEIFGTEGVS